MAGFHTISHFISGWREKRERTKRRALLTKQSERLSIQEMWQLLRRTRRRVQDCVLCFHTMSSSVINFQKPVDTTALSWSLPAVWRNESFQPLVSHVLLFDLQPCGSFTSRPFASRITSCHQSAIFFFSLRHKLYINSMRAAVEPWASVAGSLSQYWDLWPFCWLGLFQTKPGEGHTLTRIYPSGRPITTQLHVQTDMVLHTHRRKHLTKVAYSTLISIDSLF